MHAHSARGPGCEVGARALLEQQLRGVYFAAPAGDAQQRLALAEVVDAPPNQRPLLSVEEREQEPVHAVRLDVVEEPVQGLVPEGELCALRCALVAAPEELADGVVDLLLEHDEKGLQLQLIPIRDKREALRWAGVGHVATARESVEARLEASIGDVMHLEVGVLLLLTLWQAVQAGNPHVEGALPCLQMLIEQGRRHRLPAKGTLHILDQVKAQGPVIQRIVLPQFVVAPLQSSLNVSLILPAGPALLLVCCKLCRQELSPAEVAIAVFAKNAVELRLQELRQLPGNVWRCIGADPALCKIAAKHPTFREILVCACADNSVSMDRRLGAVAYQPFVFVIRQRNVLELAHIIKRISHNFPERHELGAAVKDLQVLIALQE
mmetsp:Transcript_97009/g.283525  ORF Transcript_97009/g.283525 Transcript_97009/m.283525 type:complete len:380 (-) Transcript_97009:1354-2493(-)